VLVAVAVTVAALGGVAMPRSASAAPAAALPRPTVAYQRLALPDGRYATVYTDGLAQVVDPGSGSAEFQYVPLGHGPGSSPAGTLPARADLITDLAQGQPAPYAPDDVLVAYAPDVAAPARISPGRTRADVAHPPAYTGDARLNKVLAGLGVDGAEPLLPGATPAAPTGTGEPAGGAPLDVSRLYRLQVPPASAAGAVSALRADPSIAYASPDWKVTSLRTDATPVTGGAAVKVASAPAAGGTLPTNYGLTSDAQSLLDRPGVDATSAYAAITQKFGQLPGQGQIITNVSIGSLTDASAVTDTSNPCNSWASAYGPTTIVQGGQRYIDWPGMPLIPTYTAGSTGTIDPVGQVCGADDPTLGEVGLDFSMMAPLPHDKQRPGREGSGPTDLLGIAPGASYRLMEPATSGPTSADLAATFLAAAQQQPRPSVITASLGFGFDTSGFSGRYMEDDPVMASVIAMIVQKYKIVVCVSAGDGLRAYTNAAVPPSGGSAATNVAGRHDTPTDLNDVSLSTAPSLDPDTGSIDVGSTTLNDTVSAPDQGTAFVGQQAYPETRYNGARNFASGWGTRVDISAPGDSVLALGHAFGGGAGDVSVAYTGGTSASTPEVAAAAAVVLQVARLTGNKQLSDPVKVRDFLVATASPVANPAQSDVDLNVGPQVDLGNAVQTLLAEAGTPEKPSVSRVAVVDRHPLDGFNDVFSTATDPGAIPLDHAHLGDWLTIAPDWLGLPGHGVDYALTVGHNRLATTPSARLQPSAVLAAAGLPLVATASRSVALRYTASTGGRQLAGVTVTVAFGPSDGLSTYGLAPKVPAVVRGATIPVSYDLRGLVNATDPVLVVSEPGRIDPATAGIFRPAYRLPLTALSGTVQVPVSALSGGGIYGVGIQPATAGATATTYTNFAYVRVAPTADARPPAPTLAAVSDRSTGGHSLEVGYGAPLRVSWDVRDVPGADGATLEISAAGPTATGNQNPFNNPNGTVRDANGTDTGSVYFAPLHGSHATVTLSPGQVGLDPAMTHVVRVLPTRDGRVVGEASEVSTVSRDGVKPTGGGTVFGGFGVNAHGGDGFLTANLTGGSVQVFDQSTNAVTRTVASSAGRYQTPGSIGAGPGLLAGDVGLYQRTDPDGTQSYQVLKPVATGGDGGAWTPPAADVPAGGGTAPLPAANQSTDTTAFLYGKNGPTGAYRVFTSNVGANTFSSPIDVEPAMGRYAFPYVTAFGADNGNHLAVLGTSDFFTFNGPSMFVTVDQDTGAVGTFPGVGAGEPDGLAVDSTTHTMLAPTGDGSIGLYDLTTGTGTRFTLEGAAHQHPTVDETHHYFAMQELEAPSGFGATPDNNVTSAVVIVDEHGTLVKRIAAFNFFNTSLPINGNFLQLDPATRTGYTPGPAGAQLAVFHY
jgi:hypothetical protein